MSSSSSEPLLVSVTIKYPLFHPIFQLLELLPKKPEPKLYLYIDNNWQTGSIARDLPNASELDLNQNQDIFMFPLDPDPPFDCFEP